MKSTPYFRRTFALGLFLICFASPSPRAQNIEDAPLSDTAPSLAPPAKLTAKPAPKPSRAKPILAPTKAPMKIASPTVTAKSTVRPTATKPATQKPTIAPTQIPQTNPEDEVLEDEVPDLNAAPKPSPGKTPGITAPNPVLPNVTSPGVTSATPHAGQNHAEDAALSDTMPNDATAGEEMHAHDAPDDVEPQRNAWDFATTFREDYMRQSLWAGILVALMCGYLGVYVVLKRIVFVGVALAEVSSAGVALALLLGWAPLLGATLFMLVGVVLFATQWSPRRVPRESYIGIIYFLATAVGILLIAKNPRVETSMLSLLQGDVLLSSLEQTLSLLGAALVVAILHALFAKEFTLVSFDREAAATLGFRVAGWDFLLFLTIGLAIAFSIHAVGVLLTSALLILPAASSLLLANRLKTALWCAPLLGILPVGLGLHISFVADLPASAIIVALLFAVFLAALGVSKIRR